MGAFGLYTHIQANRRRSVILIIGLFFLVYVLTFAGALLGRAFLTVAPLEDLLNSALSDLLIASPFVTFFTLVWVFVAYRWHEKMIDAVTGGYSITRDDDPQLYNLLENLCISRGMAMPKLKIVPNEALNAFATGLNEKQYAISVTTGLKRHLTDEEMEAVLGHELTHIRNGDVRVLVISVVMAGIISFVGELVFRSIFRSGVRHMPRRPSGDRKGNGTAIAVLIAIALILLSWLLSIVIRFALSRSREYLADAGAVELTKNPDAMISALRKIENRGELEGATSAVMEMCVDNPRNEFADLFATHPSIDDRIEAIVDHAGGVDPGPLAIDVMGESAADDAGGADGPWANTREPQQTG